MGRQVTIKELLITLGGSVIKFPELLLAWYISLLNAILSDLNTFSVFITGLFFALFVSLHVGILVGWTLYTLCKIYIASR